MSLEGQGCGGHLLTASASPGPVPPASVSPPCLPGKVPSPSQLSVTELPGDKVRLEWTAAAASGVLVYQIKWTPLGDGKAHEVWAGERRTISQSRAPGGLRPSCFVPGTAAGPRPVSRAPGRGHLFAGRTPVPPLHRSLSQGTGTWQSCLAYEATWSMRSPSWPTTGMGPAATRCPSATPPVGDRRSAPQPCKEREQPTGTLDPPSSRGPGP